MSQTYEDELKNKLSQLFDMAGRGYGLDFGTFHSMMSFKNANDIAANVAQYDNPMVRNGIPSLFWYSSTQNKEYLCDEVLVGNGQLDDPLGVCVSVKMKLGENNISLNGKQYTPGLITEKIVRRVIKLSHDAMEKNQLFEQPIYKKLVVGVPVRFGAVKRQILKKAMKNATDGKEIVLLPEPIAAAIAYARYVKCNNKNVLVYDLGAGTFDTVLLEPNKNRTKENPYEYIPKYPDGLFIAGDYFDQKMAEIIIHKIKSQSEQMDIDKLSNVNHVDYHRLLELAREAKEKLSIQDRFTAWIEGSSKNGGPCIQKVIVLREEFEKEIRPAIQDTIDCAYNVLVQAKMQNRKDIDILLVGGSTYIPLIKKMLVEKFKHLDEKNILQRFPEQAIALGCAIYANEEVCYTPVAFAYGIGTYLPETNRDVIDIIIPSNYMGNIKEEVTYYTRFDDQETITFKFFELDHGEIDDEIPIEEGKFTQLMVKHSFGKKVPAGTRVDVTLSLSKAGILSVIVNDKGITPLDKQVIDVSNLKIGGL